MPSIEENHEFWNDRFHWGKHRGDAWSDEWGGPTAQWKWCVYPRIRRHLPAETILEIGPGMGRWTQFLRTCCENLIVVDISERCIDVCRERFGEQGMSYHLGDGRTLSFLEDNSIDFTFSFESLIHTESDDLRSYLSELSRTLKPEATAFLHHSNLGRYKRYYDLVRRVPKALREGLQARGVLDFDGWRAATVSHQWVSREAEKLGLGVLSQELVPWGGKRLIDCFTTLCAGSVDREAPLLENRKFVERAREICRISGAYEK
jgi:ubiquinone/menaquinone biosynthesis C-methylase UbiE